MTPRRIRRLPTRRPRGAVRGIAMIEALVGILLFAIGILGLVGLQASMSRAQTVSKFRADAAYLANEIIAAMWTDRTNLASYASDATTTCTYNRCVDLVNKVSGTLPGATTSIAVAAGTGSVTVTLTWSPPSEGTRTYAITSQIQ